MSLFGGASDGGAAAAAKQQQALVTSEDNSIDQAFSGFDSNFYNTAAKNYTAAVTPGMLNDYRTTKNNLTYALARQGILNSSAAVQRNTSLGNQLASNESQIANNAQGQVNALESNVATQKGQLYAQASAGADPSLINSMAVGATSQDRAPSAIQPLGNLFADWSNQYLAGQQAQSPGTMSVWNQLGNMGYGTVGAGAGGSSVMVQ